MRNIVLAIIFMILTFVGCADVPNKQSISGKVSKIVTTVDRYSYGNDVYTYSVYFADGRIKCFHDVPSEPIEVGEHVRIWFKDGKITSVIHDNQPV